MKPTRRLIALALGTAFGTGALAQTDATGAAGPALTSALPGNAAGGAPPTPTARSAAGAPTSAPRPATSVNASRMLCDSFADYLGSTANATALIEGLRTGGPITLTGAASTSTSTSTGTGTATATATATGTSAGSGVRFTAPTGPMGYGNIRIALSLTQAELAKQGITRPTPQQIQAALLGSPAATGAAGADVTPSTPGILQMRADGMGWGRIAHTLGVRPSLAAGHMTPVTAAGNRYGPPQANGHLHGDAVGTKTHAGRTRVTAYGGPSASTGVVTAAGGIATPSGIGHSHSAAWGFVNAHGANPGAARAAVGRGHGKS